MDITAPVMTGIVVKTVQLILMIVCFLHAKTELPAKMV